MPTMTAQQIAQIRDAVKKDPHAALFSVICALQELVNVLIEKGHVTLDDLMQQRKNDFVATILDRTPITKPQ